MELKCYDINNQQITHLTQWDLNQKIIIKNLNISNEPVVHAANSCSKQALVCESVFDGSQLTFEVPNILLQEELSLKFYIYVAEPSGSAKTVHTIRIPVDPRAKPSEYEFSNNATYITIEEYESVYKAAQIATSNAEIATVNAYEAIEKINEISTDIYGRMDNADDAIEQLEILINGSTGAENIVWERGAISSSTGENTDTDTAVATRIRTSGTIPINTDVVITSIATNGLYIVFYNGSEWIKSIGWVSEISLSEKAPAEATCYRLVARADENNTEIINISDVSSLVQFYNKTNSFRADIKGLKTLEEKVNNSANAVKGTVYDKIVRVEDVSPVEHIVKVNISGKNLLDITNSNNYSLKKSVKLTSDNKYGETTSYYTIIFKNISVIPETQYTISLSHSDYGISQIYGFDDLGYCTENVVCGTSKSVKKYTMLTNANTTDLAVVIQNYVTSGFTVSDIPNLYLQLEYGNTATDYTSFIDVSSVQLTRYGDTETDSPQVYIPDANGNVEVDSLSPIMTLVTDNENVFINCVYNRDINILFANSENFEKDIKEQVEQLEMQINGSTEIEGISWGIGSILSSDYSSTYGDFKAGDPYEYNKTRAHTEKITYNSDSLVTSSNGIKVIIGLYDGNTYLGATSTWSESISLSDYTDQGATEYRVIARYVPEKEFTTTSEVSPYVKIYSNADGLKATISEIKADVENKVNQTYVDEKLEAITGGTIEGLYPLKVSWESGTISSTTTGSVEAGGNATSPKRARVENYLECDNSIVITATNDRQFVLYFYSTENTSTTTGIQGLLGKTDWLTGTVNLTDHMLDGAKYFRIVGQYQDTYMGEEYDEDIILVTDYIVIKKYQAGMDVSLKTLMEKTTELTEDVEKIKNGIPFGDIIEDEPQTQGILNALLRAKHLADVQYATKAILPRQPLGDENDYPVGTEITGVIYSSTREIDKMVGLNVSLHTFMTAIANQNSKIYTERLTTRNAETYYGTVCSAFVCYALGIPYTFTTYHMVNWEGFNEIGLYDLQLCDFMVTTKPAGHTILITGIKRDKYKRIVGITTTEAMKPTVTTITYTLDEFINKYVNDVDNKGYNYRFFRYPMIGKTKYVPTEYVPLLDETPTEIIYPDIITNYGDKATVLTGTDITANVINADGYNSIEVYKDDTLFSTHNVEDVTISSAEAGHYEFRMIGTDKTSSTFIIVTDCSASKNGNTISFSSSNSEPLCLSIVNADHGNDYILPIESTDTSIDVDLNNYPALRQDQPIIYMKVYFKNKYGSVAVKVEI